MRILLTTDTIGGVWTFTCELTDQLLRRGHYVALVSFGRLPDDNQRVWCDHIAGEHQPRFSFHAGTAPLEWMQNNEAAFIEGASLLLAVVHEFQPDLIHSSQFCWGALSCDVPVLITAHSDVLSWADACRSAALEESDWLTQYRALVQRGLDGAAAVVAPTKWMAEALERHFDVLFAVATTYNGRSLQLTGSAQERKLQAVSVGRLWDEAKGLQTLLEVEPCLPILVAGEEDFGASGTDTGDLRALGTLNSDALHQLFRESSIYIVSSIYEPFGLAPLEAALCGCAVVARDLASLREVWADAALYFQSSEELQSALNKLMMNREQLISLQGMSRKRAEQFTAERMAEEYVTLYQALCMQSASSRSSAEELVTHAA